MLPCARVGIGTVNHEVGTVAIFYGMDGKLLVLYLTVDLVDKILVIPCPEIALE